MASTTCSAAGATSAFAPASRSVAPSTMSCTRSPMFINDTKYNMFTGLNSSGFPTTCWRDDIPILVPPLTKMRRASAGLETSGKCNMGHRRSSRESYNPSSPSPLAKGGPLVGSFFEGYKIDVDHPFSKIEKMAEIPADASSGFRKVKGVASGPPIWSRSHWARGQRRWQISANPQDIVGRRVSAFF